MLAPIDKLKSKVNDIIQIVVTTACTLNCSNCTQLLPFRKDYLHMSVECFRMAVESLRDWPGVVALFGGNPCSHPQFPELCRILAEVIPQQERRGLWSNDTLGHHKVVKETFWPNGRFNLNAHGHSRAALRMMGAAPERVIPKSWERPSMHAPILADWHDFGLSESDWLQAREGCDINQKWSGAIVERDGLPYAYFCEVAAALDGVRRQNNGLLVFNGWWRLDMDSNTFRDQVRTCCDAGCGVPLKIVARKDSDETYDMSPRWYRDLPEKPSRPTGIYIVDDTQVPQSGHENTDYMGVRGPR